MSDNEKNVSPKKKFGSINYGGWGALFLIMCMLDVFGLYFFGLEGVTSAAESFASSTGLNKGFYIPVINLIRTLRYFMIVMVAKLIYGFAKGILPPKLKSFITGVLLVIGLVIIGLLVYATTPI